MKYSVILLYKKRKANDIRNTHDKTIRGDLALQRRENEVGMGVGDNELERKLDRSRALDLRDAVRNRAKHAFTKVNEARKIDRVDDRIPVERKSERAVLARDADAVIVVPELRRAELDLDLRDHPRRYRLPPLALPLRSEERRRRRRHLQAL